MYIFQFDYVLVELGLYWSLGDVIFFQGYYGVGEWFDEGGWGCLVEVVIVGC